MRILYQLTIEDYLSLHRYLHEYRITKRRPRWRVFIFEPLVILALSGFLSLTIQSWYPFVIGGVFTGLTTGVVGWSILGFDKRMAKQLAESQDKLMLIPRELELTEACLHQWSALSDTRLSWSVIHKIVLEKKHIYVFISALSAMIIPRRLLPEAMQNELLLTLVRYSDHPVICDTGENPTGVPVTPSKVK